MSKIPGVPWPTGWQVRKIGEPGRRYLLGTRRHDLVAFQTELSSPGWQHLGPFDELLSCAGEVSCRVASW